MSLDKINRKILRQRAAAKEIFSIAELARRANCSREAIYFAIEKPDRFPVLMRRLNKILS